MISYKYAFQLNAVRVITWQLNAVRVITLLQHALDDSMYYQRRKRSFNSHITTAVLSAWIQSIIQCATLTNSTKCAGTILSMYVDALVSLWIYNMCMIYKHFIFAMRSKNFIGDIQKSLTLQLKCFLFVLFFETSYAQVLNKPVLGISKIFHIPLPIATSLNITRSI